MALEPEGVDADAREDAGQRLDVVLRDQDLAAGDFVRRCKMVVDLLGQISSAAESPER